MQVSDVRRQVLATIERARRTATDRRERADAASREYETFLEQVAVPLFRQVSQVLRAEGRGFTVFTPAGGVRLNSDKSAQDFIELELDTTGETPRVMGRTSRARGRQVIEAERPVGGPGPVRDLTEEDVLEFLLEGLEPLVDR